MPGEYRNKASRIANLITQFYYDPCSPDPIVYLELAIPALLMVGYGIESPDIREIITKATGRSSLCHLKSGIHANRVEKYGGKAAKVTRALWRITETVDLAVFFAFAIGVLGSALIQALLGLTHLKQCQEKPPAGSYGWGTAAYGGWVGGPDWGAGFVWRAADWPDTPQAVMGALIPPGKTWTHYGSAQCINLSAVPVPFEVGWFRNDETEPLKIVGSDYEALEGSHYADRFQYRNDTGSSVSITGKVRFPLSPPGDRIVTLPWGTGYSRVHG